MISSAWNFYIDQILCVQYEIMQQKTRNNRQPDDPCSERLQSSIKACIFQNNCSRNLISHSEVLFNTISRWISNKFINQIKYSNVNGWERKKRENETEEPTTLKGSVIVFFFSLLQGSIRCVYYKRKNDTRILLEYKNTLILQG